MDSSEQTPRPLPLDERLGSELDPLSGEDWDEQFAHLQIQSQDARLQLYYSGGMVAADTPIAQVPLVAMDFETTGLDLDNDDIVSIGVTPFNLQRIFCRQSAHWIVRPRQPLDERSVVIHGITHSDVNNAPELETILDELLEILAGKVVVVHYRQIERNFLANALMRRIHEEIRFPVIDTLVLEERALSARRGIMGKLMRKPLGSLRLADSRQRYSLPPYQSHQALTDALATAELFQAQIAHHYHDDTPVGDLWC